MKSLRLRLEAEIDPVKRELLTSLLKQETAGKLSPPDPHWGSKPN